MRTSIDCQVAGQLVQRYGSPNTLAGTEQGPQRIDLVSGRLA
jgi:hypothetical protein